MKLTFIDYFSSKLAKAPRFCNRIKERALLINNIKRSRHTVLVSPRRYGKSSLVHQVVVDMRIPCAFIDLFLAHDGKAITKRILDGIAQVISQIMPLSQKALTTAQGFFSHFKIVMQAGGFGLQLSHETTGFDPVEQIFDSLKSLAKLAESKQKKILLFLDEFQDIANAENSKSIQGAIRNVAQDTSNLVFVFSGSTRHLLLELFDDKNKPLYMLCDKILLNRMSSKDYISYIQDAAQDKWGKPIDQSVLNRIFGLTELHPFYVNMLCNEIWHGEAAYLKHSKRSGQMPTVDDVMNAWLMCYEIEDRRLVSELEKLTANQQDILKTIAQTPVSEPGNQKFLAEVGLPLSSVRIGVKALVDKDMVHRVKNEDPLIPALKKGQYRVLDPLLAYALRRYS